MRIPTEYILALVSVGALTLIAIVVFVEPSPYKGVAQLNPEMIAGATTEVLNEELTVTAFSKFLALLGAGEDTIPQVEIETLEDVTQEVSPKKQKNIFTRALEAVIPKEPEEEVVAEIIEQVTVLPMSTLEFKAFNYFNSSLEEKDPISFSAVVANTGDTHSATSTFIFTFDKNSDGIIDNVLAERQLLPLIPGETRAETWKNALLPTPGTHTAAVCLVPLRVLNEAENCTSFKLTVVPQESDLIVQPISITPENPIAGDTITVSSPLKNKGKGRALISSTRLRIDAQNNGSWDIVIHSPTAVLESDEILAKEWTSVWRSVHGLVKIEVCTDSENVLTEADEKNNCRTDVFTITPGDYIGATSVTFEIENGEISPASHSIIPGGFIILSNRDNESYSISGDLGSVFLSPETEGSIQAPLYEGTYTFSTITEGTSFEGTVIVE